VVKVRRRICLQMLSNHDQMFSIAQHQRW